jgi:formylglycine-generating enzyme required for sulfatase activity
LTFPTIESGVHGEILRARSLTDALFDRVLPRAMYARPIPERHRIVFYAGHLEAFDWNLLGKRYLHLGTVNSELDSLFATGIDPPQQQLPTDTERDWPSLSHIRHYVARVRETLNAAMTRVPEALLHMALEHRLMHAETLTYLLHNLPYESRLVPQVRMAAAPEAPPNLQLIPIPAGAAALGRSPNAGFGWDNEYPRQERDVAAFRISRHKITNAEYLRFVEEGGEAPHYWTCRNRQWFYRGFARETPLPLSNPVYVTFAQADAWARWAGYRLPTEEQFHRAAYGTPSGSVRPYPWGNSAPRPAFGNFNSYGSEALPVTATPDGDSAFGVSQMLGNGWEWTRTVFAPFPGFSPSPWYPGYSADFFDGQHRVIKGGSCVTDARLLRSSFRNWFREHFRYAYTTFRVVEEN